MTITRIEPWLAQYQSHSPPPGNYQGNPKIETLRLSEHWIGGSWQETIGTGEDRFVINPNRNAKILNYTFSQGTMQHALTAATSALVPLRDCSWSDKLTMMRQLCERLRQHRTILAHALQIEVGKPSWDAFEEINAAIRHCQGLVDRGNDLQTELLRATTISLFGERDRIALQPVGIAATYLPFPNPVLTLVVHFSCALLAGCPLIVFSSGHATLISLLFGTMAEQLALPAGALNILLGEFNDFRGAIADKRVAAVLYVGSKEHGELLQKDAISHRKKHMIIQGGGKNTVIIHPSADLAAAVKSVVYGVCKTTGQLPTSTSRVFVHDSLLAEFCERLVASLQRLNLGPCDDLNTGELGGPLMGPLISARSVERFLRFQTMARREAKISIQLGKKHLVQDYPEGFFVQPGIHLLEGLNPSSLYQSNLLFSPDLAIYPYKTLEAAFDSLHKSQQAYTLAFMGQREYLQPFIPYVPAPNIIINGPTVESEGYFPYCSRSLLNQSPYGGIGLVLSLCYPHMVRESSKTIRYVEGLLFS